MQTPQEDQSILTDELANELLGSVRKNFTEPSVTHLHITNDLIEDMARGGVKSKDGGLIGTVAELARAVRAGE